MVRGELIEIAGANEEHCNISSILHIELGYYVRQKTLGRVYGADARYLTVPGTATVRQSDVSFVENERVTRGVNTMPFAPDLAIEVTSTGNAFEDIEEKVSEYLGNGSKLVWVVNRRKKVVYIYRVGSNQRQTIGIDDELDGENVIPGFKLAINSLFE